MTSSETGPGNRWEADSDDESHFFVFEYGENLLDLLEPTDGERILDLGCGTGHLSASIAETGAEVITAVADRLRADHYPGGSQTTAGSGYKLFTPVEYALNLAGFRALHPRSIFNQYIRTLQECRNFSGGLDDC
jgi:SAM-dependent methyltransferase